MIQQSKNFRHRIWQAAASAVLVLVFLGSVSVYAGQNFVVEGVYEAALDLPRVYFTLKRDPNGALLYDHSSGEQYAFLDTGASGILLSQETADFMDVSRHPDAEYADVGVGGIEYFDVSEPLYVMTTGIQNDPLDFAGYSTNGAYRLQIRQSPAGTVGVVDVMGVPVMAGKVAVFNTGLLNDQIAYFPGEVMEADDPNIPSADIEVPLRMEKYINLSSPENTPPLPDVGYNPVIDNIAVKRNGASSEGTWLLDTGAMVSLISVEQGMKLGLVDANGTPLVETKFTAAIGGVGANVEIPGFEIDRLVIPTLEGYDLVFKNARVGVHDIGIYDEDRDKFIILDGVLGSNFLTVSVELSTYSMAATAFENAVVDFEKGILGFDVVSSYQPNLPDGYRNYTGDVNGDYYVNFNDVEKLTEVWLSSDCNQGTDCVGADMDSSGTVNFSDYSLLSDNWLTSPPCGSDPNPWKPADLNRDCRVDFKDLAIFAEEWLNSCDKLNWQCRQADINLDNTVNLRDLPDFSGKR